VIDWEGGENKKWIYTKKLKRVNKRVGRWWWSKLKIKRKKKKSKELTYLLWLMTYLESLSTVYLCLKASEAWRYDFPHSWSIPLNEGASYIITNTEERSNKNNSRKETSIEFNNNERKEEYLHTCHSRYKHHSCFSMKPFFDLCYVKK